MKAPNAQSETFRLAATLRRLRDEFGGFNKLADEIANANAKAVGRRRKIDRRKLARIAKHDMDAALSIREFEILDVYLETLGESLARQPILTKPALLEELVARNRVTFLLGAKSRKDPAGEDVLGVTLSDVNAMTHVMREVNRQFRSVHFDLQHVMLQATPEEARQQLENHRLWEIWDDQSLVCIGSPRACHAAEAMLSEMFGVAPFTRPTDVALPVPTHLVWGDTTALPSCISLRTLDVRDINPVAAASMTSHNLAAIQVGEELHLERRGRDRTHAHGLIFAQRRRSGVVWVVLAGLSGAGTTAAAAALASMSKLPSAPPAGHSAVVCTVVRAPVTAVPNVNVVQHVLSGAPEILRRWPGDVDGRL